MAAKGHIPRRRIEVLTEDDVQRMYAGALTVLEKTGAVIEHEGALEILHGAGCRVDRKARRVRFPAHLVEDRLGKCPDTVVLKGRNPQHDLEIRDPLVYFANYPSAGLADLDSGDPIAGTTQDLAQVLKVLDALDEVHLLLPPVVCMQDVPPVLYYNTFCAMFLKNSGKPHFDGTTHGSVRFSMKMWEVAGVRPVVAANTADPLVMPEDQVEGLLLCAEAGYPLQAGAGPVGGATAPVTLAGSLVMHFAECMIPIVLAQTVKPGTEVVTAMYAHPMEVRRGTPCAGSVERALLSAATCQFWHGLKIPCILAGASSDSVLPDYQCATEKMMSAVVQAMAGGGNVFSFIGSVNDETMFSPEVAIMDNEAAHMIARILEGVRVTEETLAVELINTVGPIPGEFLSTAHTREWIKQELFVPSLANKLTPAEWAKAGRKTMLDKAREKKDEILATHEVEPLTREQERAIDEILEEARSHYQQVGML
jgi:trimethylamine--corrinoid protein Co-methyltransferase